MSTIIKTRLDFGKLLLILKGYKSAKRDIYWMGTLRETLNKLVNRKEDSHA